MNSIEKDFFRIYFRLKSCCGGSYFAVKFLLKIDKIERSSNKLLIS